MPNLKQRLNKARELSWKHLGKRIAFYLPGMFIMNGITGKYPAVSITGNQCALQCDHCQGKILSSMIPATDPESLLRKCVDLSHKGYHGVLISGGCTENGRLPWDMFIPTIRKIKEQTHLIVSVHSGIVTEGEALALKRAGVDQALIDVIGSDDTFRKIYHVPFGVSKIIATMDALKKAGLPIIPHIICGLDYGEIKGERKAIDMIAPFDVDQVVIVSLMKIPGTPAADASLPKAEEVADIIVETRRKMPAIPISLGCARQRGNSRLEVLAVDAGINRMALPSEEAVHRALSYGLELRYQKTCCSVSQDLSSSCWQ
jgi:uncharacterized radical SAM superfamily protein